jgi:hypothetical protein
MLGHLARPSSDSCNGVRRATTGPILGLTPEVVQQILAAGTFEVGLTGVPLNGGLALEQVSSPKLCLPSARPDEPLAQSSVATGDPCSADVTSSLQGEMRLLLAELAASRQVFERWLDKHVQGDVPVQHAGDSGELREAVQCLREEIARTRRYAHRVTVSLLVFLVMPLVLLSGSLLLSSFQLTPLSAGLNPWGSCDWGTWDTPSSTSSVATPDAWSVQRASSSRSSIMVSRSASTLQSPRWLWVLPTPYSVEGAPRLAAHRLGALPDLAGPAARIPSHVNQSGP